MNDTLHPETKKQRQSTRRNFARLDEETFPSFEAGTVWLVGAGPGAPGLLSLMAYHAMQNCDIVVYDALVNKSILNWVNKDAELEYAGKRGGKPSPTQTDITLRLIELAKQGKRVLRLKGGDPFMFGRGGEESQTLSKAGITFRIVPGITAGIGGLAYAGLPATHRETNHSVTFLTGHDASGQMPVNVNWKSMATASPLLVMYMAVKNLPEIAAALIDGGRAEDTPVCLISNASLPEQTILETKLGGIEAFLKANVPATPAIVVVGYSPDIRNSINWYKNQLKENPIG